MSNIEIELKLAAKEGAIEAVRQYLSTLPHQHSEPQSLLNIYFDTADKQLRRWDMGLRIRSCDGHYEMTMKTKGVTIGGLHQRPEYNIDITSPELDLAAFPREVWPENTDVSALQSQLEVLFSTDFKREKWLVTIDNSDVEVVLDRGEIHAGKHTLPIQEFELELKKGTIGDVLNLTKKLADFDGLRLSEKSKAARGYTLANPQTVEMAAPISSFDYEQTPIDKALASLLLLWQQHEEYWLDDHADAREGLKSFLHFVQAFLVHYRNSAPQFVQDMPLAKLQQAVSAPENSADDLCYSACWLRCKLGFTQWLIALTLP